MSRSRHPGEWRGRPSGQHQQQQAVVLRVQQPGLGAEPFLARRILHSGAEIEGRTDPAVEPRIGFRSLRLTLPAEGEATLLAGLRSAPSPSPWLSGDDDRFGDCQER